jgi:hypothetical protein
VVTRDPALSGLAEKITTSMSTAYAQQRIATVGPRQDKDTGPPVKLDDLKRLVGDAQGRFFDGDFEGAVEQATEGIKRFELKFAYSDNEDAWSTYSELQILRVLALKRIDEDKKAEEVLEALCAQRPSFIPDPSVVPPKTVSLHREVLDRLKKKAKNAKPLKVVSRPAGAQVVIDGRKVGVSPVEVADLLPGEHYVLVSVGEERFEEKVTVGAKGKLLEAELGDPRAGAARQFNDRLRLRTPVASLEGMANKIAPSVLTAVISRAGRRVEVLVGRFDRGRLEAVTGTTVADDLSDVDQLASALAQVSRVATGDASIDGVPNPTLRERFLGDADRPEIELRDPGKEADPDSNLTTYLLIGGGVAAAVAVIAVVGAAAGGGGYYYFTYGPGAGPNEGTDIVIDASRLAESQ